MAPPHVGVFREKFVHTILLNHIVGEDQCSLNIADWDIGPTPTQKDNERILLAPSRSETPLDRCYKSYGVLLFRTIENDNKLVRFIKQKLVNQI